MPSSYHHLLELMLFSYVPAKFAYRAVGAIGAMHARARGDQSDSSLETLTSPFIELMNRVIRVMAHA